MKPEKRVGIYCRVSTQDQNLDLQINELTAYALTRGWKIHKIYQEKATGTNNNRPMLKDLLTDARLRKLDIILVWKLGRFARSLKNLISMLQELTDLDVDFIALKDQIDMTPATGRLMTHILGAFGEFEAAIIKERIRAGLDAAKTRGVKLGRPKLRDDLTIQALRSQGFSIREIASTVKLSVGAIQRSIKGSISPKKVL